MKGAYYDLSIRKNRYGNLDLTVDAYSDDAAWGLASNTIFTAPLPAAMLLEDDDDDN